MAFKPNANTAYWPERFTPLSLLQQAHAWREKAKKHLDVAASTAALQHLRKNATRAEQKASDNPSPLNQNAAGSIGNQVADRSLELAEELVGLESCPLPPASVIVYQEPGEPASWAAEAITHGEAGSGISALRVHGYESRSTALAALRDVTEHPQILSACNGTDYHAARVRAACLAVRETQPLETRIRLAGTDRPEDWEVPK